MSEFFVDGYLDDVRSLIRQSVSPGEGDDIVLVDGFRGTRTCCVTRGQPPGLLWSPIFGVSIAASEYSVERALVESVIDTLVQPNNNLLQHEISGALVHVRLGGALYPIAALTPKPTVNRNIIDEVSVRTMTTDLQFRRHNTLPFYAHLKKLKAEGHAL